jgi:AcrR family transcriptional regulator
MAKRDRRQDILLAARRVFAHQGYHEAKVGNIAAEAGVAKGTVYLHFADKRSMFVELINSLFDRLEASILTVDPAGDVASQVKHNIRAIISVLVNDSETMHILFTHASGLDPAFSEKMDGFHENLKQMLTESLEEGQMLGIVAEGNARIYASFTIGALREVLRKTAHSNTHAQSREQIAEELYAFLVGGYLRIDEPRPAASNKASP